MGIRVTFPPHYVPSDTKSVIDLLTSMTAQLEKIILNDKQKVIRHLSSTDAMYILQNAQEQIKIMGTQLVEVPTTHRLATPLNLPWNVSRHQEAFILHHDDSENEEDTREAMQRTAITYLDRFLIGNPRNPSTVLLTEQQSYSCPSIITRPWADKTPLYAATFVEAPAAAADTIEPDTANEGPASDELANPQKTFASAGSEIAVRHAEQAAELGLHRLTELAAADGSQGEAARQTLAKLAADFTAASIAHKK